MSIPKTDLPPPTMEEAVMALIRTVRAMDVTLTSLHRRVTMLEDLAMLEHLEDDGGDDARH